MSVAYGMTHACRLDFLKGVHQPGDVYMIALYGENASLNPLIEYYETAGEAKGQGYVAGGKVLTGYAVTLEGAKACLGWDRVVLWKNATITARSAVIYNKSKANRALAILDLGAVTSSTNGDWKLTLPQTVLWIG